MEDKFFLTAECTWENGADGKSVGYQMINVRVKDAEGMPVKGLKKSDFKVYDMGFSFGGKTIDFVQEIKAEAPSLPLLDGTYRLKISRNIGLSGQFVYAVVVNKRARGRSEKSGGSGQTLLSFVKIR